eukprot:SAG31_NODE_715_length_12634_cov_5.289190_11_plen_272_part_00
MRNLISGWREKWASAQPLSLQNFTFIEHQLSAYSGGANIPGLRWSQQGALMPWTTTEGQQDDNVAMTVGIDLSDPGSPCGNVHIRNKTAVGERMALAARALAYGDRTVKYTGPVAKAFKVSPATSATAGSITVEYGDSATLPLQFRTIAQTTAPTLQGFDLLYRSEHSENSSWVSSPMATVVPGKSSVVVSLPMEQQHQLPLAIRYAWLDVPNTQLLYDSSPVGDVKQVAVPMAMMSGLPAPPFYANCASNEESIIECKVCKHHFYHIFIG